MRKERWLAQFTVVVGALALLLSACGGDSGGSSAGSSGQTINWDFVVYSPLTEHPVPQDEKKFAEMVKSDTHGQLDITVRWAGESPYKPAEYVSRVGDGSVQLGDAYSGFAAGDFTYGALPYLPLFIRTPQETDKVLKALVPTSKSNWAGSASRSSSGTFTQPKSSGAPSPSSRWPISRARRYASPAPASRCS